jgi:hypothetical protein
MMIGSTIVSGVGTVHSNFRGGHIQQKVQEFLEQKYK